VCVLCLCMACGVCAVCACAWRVCMCVHVHGVCACAWRVWMSACAQVCLCGVRDFFFSISTINDFDEHTSPNS
jgi:hypothetical protein